MIALKLFALSALQIFFLIYTELLCAYTELHFLTLHLKKADLSSKHLAVNFESRYVIIIFYARLMPIML